MATTIILLLYGGYCLMTHDHMEQRSDVTDSINMNYPSSSEYAVVGNTVQFTNPQDSFYNMNVSKLNSTYLFVILPAGQNTTSDGVFAMNMTNVEANANHYIVHGESYNLPSDSEKYFMNIKFFDKNDAMVFEVNSTADEFKKGIIWQGDLPSNNVTHVGFKLIDLNNKVLSQNNYTIS